MPRLIALLLSLCVAGSASAKTIEEDVQYYLGLLGEPNSRVQSTEFEALSGAGLSDPRLFDAVEKRLLEDCEDARMDRENRARVAWYFRALGFSGQEKYQPTLSRFTEDKVYRNYAIAALRDQPSYAKWNPVISDRSKFDPKRSDDANRILNMLGSDDHLLQRIGAKRAFLTHQADPAVAKMLAQRLEETYRTAEDSESVETAGWMINALSRAGIEQYAPLLREVSKGAKADKLRLRAQAMLDRRR